MTTTEWIALQLEGGAQMVLQRVPPSLTAEDVARALDGVVVGSAHAEGAVPRVLDARRNAPDIDDVDRLALVEQPDRSPLVILLDHASASALAVRAPQTVSWAGGIWLPPDHPLRGVRTEDELEQGLRALTLALESDPDLGSTHAGEEVAVDLLTRQVFFREGTATPLDVARERRDDGVVYLGRLPR